MNLEDWHLVFVTACILLVLGAFTPVITSLLPDRSEPFMALAILGREGMAEDYYPGDGANIAPSQPVNWHLYLYNHMGEARYVSVKIKLSNSTIEPPNSTSCTPCPAPAAYQIRRVLLDNETWISPLSWEIINTSIIDEYVKIEHVSFNGDVIRVDAASENGNNFRVILELWVYDEELEELRFGWRQGDGLRCAWNQIWFNSTIPG